MMPVRATTRDVGRRLPWAALALVAFGSPAAGQVVGEVVAYTSGGKPVTVEYFAPARPGRFPAVVLLHGSGGLEQATGSTFRAMASTLAARGYVALIPHYFEKTDHPPGRALRDGEYSAWLEAVADAIEDAASRPEVDPTRFALIGYSMGSGLAMVRAIRDPRVKAVVSLSGAFGPASPNPALPPLLILHGSRDSSTPVDYVKKYAEKLVERDMPHSVHVYPGMGHNFDSSHFVDATRRSVAFLDKYLKPTPPRR